MNCLSRCHNTIVKTVALSAALLATAAILAACGSSDSDDSSSGSTDLTEVKDTVDRLLGSTGTYSEPPTSAPKPEPGQNIWLISCGQAFTACSIPIGAAEDASKAMGWNARIYDSKGDPAAAGTGIQQAIADNADAIFIYFMDCQYIKSPLEQAEEAGILVASAESWDCDETGKGPSLFDYQTTYSGGLEPFDKPESIAKWAEAWGAAQADYAIAETDGEANVLGFSDDTGLAGQTAAKGYQEELDKCDGCSFTLVKFPLTDLGTNALRSKADQAILKNPDANVVAGMYDAITTSGVAEAANASGRDLIVMAGEGAEGGMDLLRDGEVTAGAGIPLGWEAYGAIDNINRLLQNEPTAPTGIGVQLFDQDQNVPPSGPYEAPFDYVKLYEEAWGVG